MTVHNVKFLKTGAEAKALVEKEAHKKTGVPPAGQSAQPPWSDKVQDGFRYLMNVTRYKADLSFISDHPDQFAKFDPKPLSQQINAVGDVIDRLKSWIIKCISTRGKVCPDGMSLPFKLQIPNYSPRRARDWVTPDPANPNEQFIDTVPYDAVLELQGEWQYTHSSSDALPITSSTRTILRSEEGSGDVKDLPSQNVREVPKGYAVYFRFIDPYFGDNQIFYGSPGQARLAGPLSGFISGQ